MFKPLVRVKICGITSTEDARAAEQLGADAIGIIFYPGSKRFVDDLERAAEICASVGPFTVVTGLFVDHSSTEVERVLKRVPLGLLQFHGSETPEFCEQFDRPYIKSLSMHPGVSVLEAFEHYASARAILLDTYKLGVPGGTGEVFDWERIPAERAGEIVLAGGLNPDNVNHACTAVMPYGVDVCGGVEARPGVKSIEKMRSFIANAKRGETR